MAFFSNKAGQTTTFCPKKSTRSPKQIYKRIFKILILIFNKLKQTQNLQQHLDYTDIALQILPKPKTQQAQEHLQQLQDQPNEIEKQLRHKTTNARNPTNRESVFMRMASQTTAKAP